MFIETLKRNLQEKLKEHNMNVNELEKQAGIRNSKIRKILLGYSNNPTVETLLIISKVFCCSIDELIGNDVKNDDLPLPNDTLWDKHLMRSVFKETFDYICTKNISINFKEIIQCVLEIYNYCLSKNNGEFDKQFFEWYFDKHLKGDSSSIEVSLK